MEKKRHPVRGFFSGLTLGLGQALLFISYSLAPFGALTPVVMVIAGSVIGIAAGLFGPARGGRAVTPVMMVLLLLAGLPAGALTNSSEPADSSLSGGCTGSASSSDAGGAAIGRVNAPGAGASPNKPFVADIEGSVSYEGSSAEPIKDHAWRVAVYGIPVRRGGSPNEDGETATKGSIDVGSFFPLEVAGLYYVSGDIKGTGGSCEGAVWVKLAGSPVGTLPWIIGLALAISGLIGAFLSLPRPKVSA